MKNNPSVLTDMEQVNVVELNQRNSFAYRKPCLKKLGDLRSITLGASAYTTTESGVAGKEYWPKL